MSSSTTVTIYTLNDPETGEIRYVGYTRQPLEKRLKNHLYCPASRKKGWVTALRAKGLKPSIHPVQIVSAKDWVAAEQYWVRYFLDQGCPLTNGSPGGQGGVLYPVSAETREKIGAAQRGKTISEKQKNAISKAAKRRWSEWKAEGSFTPEATRQRNSSIQIR